MLPALILGIWLLVSMERGKQIFSESTLFVLIAMAIHYLMEWTVPEVTSVWALAWGLRWLFVAVAFWISDKLGTNMVSGALIALAAGAGYFFLDATAGNLAIDWLS